VYTYGISDKVHGASVGPLYDLADRFNNLTAWYLLTGAAAAQAAPTQGP
jgi:hypothetical protein